jgi:hypothetical protein
MQTPLDYDLKNYRAPEHDDRFQVITPSQAGIALIYLVAIVCLYEYVFRAMA